MNTIKRRELTSREAVAYYDRERQRCEVKALAATDPATAAQLRRTADRFRGMRDAVARLCGIDRNGVQVRKLETAAFDGPTTKRKYLNNDTE